MHAIVAYLLKSERVTINSSPSVTDRDAFPPNMPKDTDGGSRDRAAPIAPLDARRRRNTRRSDGIVGGLRDSYD